MENQQLLEKSDEALVAVLEALAGGKLRVSQMEGMASAARQIAEARAWLIDPGQPHGANGGTDVSVGK